MVNPHTQQYHTYISVFRKLSSYCLVFSEETGYIIAIAVLVEEYLYITYSRYTCVVSGASGEGQPLTHYTVLCGSLLGKTTRR